jgi:hypothetical protein
MQNSKLAVVVIQTPNSQRSAPLLTELRRDKRFNIEILDAKITRTIGEVEQYNIEYNDVEFFFFERRQLLPTEIGCADSHNRARKILSQNQSGGIVFEDDARVTDIDWLYKVSIEFLASQKNINSILNLTGFRARHFGKLSGFSDGKSFFKIFGKPDLAVGYVLTSDAARELYESNIPISNVADWPNTSCKFFIPIFPPILHGDSISTSVVIGGGSDSRTGISAFEKLLFFTCYRFVSKGKSVIGFMSYFKRVYVEKFYWHFNILYIRFMLLKRLK